MSHSAGSLIVDEEWAVLEGRKSHIEMKDPTQSVDKHYSSIERKLDCMLKEMFALRSIVENQEMKWCQCRNK